jgi:nucleoside-diphosphate-sugar epimerase
MAHMSTNVIVVLGAGQIGSQVTEHLLAQGHAVRQVRRSGASSQKGQLEVRTGDLSDQTFAAEVAKGATALIHCAVPPYHQWTTLLEPVNEGVLHAARTSKAPLVVLDNLYGYGKPNGPMTEKSPVAPCSKKGELRAKVAARLMEAHTKGDARVAIARAADFYGPGVTLAAIYGERFLGRAKKGQGAECFGPPDLLHSYSYGADVAAGLITLAKSEKAPGEIWHLPVAPAESTRAVTTRFGKAMGVELGTSQVPGFVLQVMALFSPPVKELLEMRYQWDVPFVLDDAKFRAAFGGEATSLEVGIAATVKWLKAR